MSTIQLDIPEEVLVSLKETPETISRELVILEDLLYLLEEKNAFFATLNLQGELEGYCSFGSDGQVPGGDYSAEALDIGIVKFHQKYSQT